MIHISEKIDDTWTWIYCSNGLESSDHVDTTNWEQSTCPKCKNKYLKLSTDMIIYELEEDLIE